MTGTGASALGWRESRARSAALGSWPTPDGPVAALFENLEAGATVKAFQEVEL